MAAWLIPALKAVLPHVGTIVAAAAPVFTRKKDDPAAATDPALLQRQVEELQAVAARNDAHIKALAEQLQQALSALDQAARGAEANLRRTQALCYAALAVSMAAMLVAVFVR